MCTLEVSTKSWSRDSQLKLLLISADSTSQKLNRNQRNPIDCRWNKKTEALDVKPAIFCRTNLTVKQMLSTYLPQRVKLQPETATAPASAFSAGLFSSWCSSSEQQDAEIRLYKVSEPSQQQRRRLCRLAPSPQILEAPADLWLYRKSLDLRYRVRNGNQAGEVEFQPRLVSGSPDTLEFAQTQAGATWALITER